MNTNIDTAALEKLANEIFTALPGTLPDSLMRPVPPTGALPISFPAKDTWPAAPAVLAAPPSDDSRPAGPGKATPASDEEILLQHGGPLDLKEPQTSLPDPNLPAPGQIPRSEAGSGISPSAARYKASGTNTQTHTNTHKSADGKPPAGTHTGLSSAPSIDPSPGAYPSMGQSPAGYPFPGEHSFQSELEQALNTVHSYAPSGQLPYSGLPAKTPSFYFLPHHAIGSSRDHAAGAHGSMHPPFNVNLVRQDFPILREQVGGRPLIWLDNAATTQKPRQVIERLSYFYEHENSNIHRAAHDLAARATDAYETARKKMQQFLNASSANEIVFVRGSTEAINLVAKSWGEQHLKAGDEIVVTHLEHHANIVPWQQLADKKGLVLKVAPVDDDGQVLLNEYAKLLGPKTKLVSFTQVSNALGTVTPAKVMIEMAHQAGARVLLDGAQAVSHMRADVQALNPDWYVFSGHKVFGPTGIGVLYGREELLNATQPWQGGGNMISDVTFEHTQYQNAPSRFEAGTGNIADAVGLGAAIDYVTRIGIDAIQQYEHYLLEYATGLLKDIPGLRLIGTARDKAGVLSFVLKGFRTEEVGNALNREGIAVRSGHHCAQPILRRFGVESTVRPSLALYNTCADIDALAETVYRLASSRAPERRTF